MTGGSLCRGGTVEAVGPNVTEFAPGDEIEVLLAEDEESLHFRAASQASAT